MSREISTHIAEDKDFDILSGAAGIIPVMIGLSKLTSGDELAYAHRCAQHLLQYSERQGDSLSWSSSDPSRSKANLTGFVHGASGIGWALISLGCATDRPDYITAGQQAFAYEALHFDDQEQDWYDLRTNGVAANKNGLHFANGWCTGAAGIGLSRITTWAMLGKQDKALLSEASLALAATLRNFHHLGNDTLCHGRAGNAEFFLRFAQLKSEPAFQIEANVQAQSQWRNFEKARSWILGKVSIDVFPGLMVGLAGLGLHFLRLAHPEQIPSPLLLDAPHKH
jgi:lantibiotic modifying enzyme